MLGLTALSEWIALFIEREVSTRKRRRREKDSDVCIGTRSRLRLSLFPGEERCRLGVTLPVLLDIRPPCANRRLERVGLEVQISSSRPLKSQGLLVLALFTVLYSLGIPLHLVDPPR